MECRVMHEMTPARWERVQKLYHAARARAEADRARFLGEACSGDDLLRSEVQALLNQPVSTGSFVDFLGGPAPPQFDEQARATLAGRRLGSYQVLALAGRGGMGEVYRARDTEAWPRRRDQGAAARSSPPTPSGWRGSSARRERSLPSIIRTSAPSTASRRSRACRRSCWSSSRARRWPIACTADRCRSREALADRAADRRRARRGAREGHHSSRPEARQHQDHARRRREGPRLRSGEGGRERAGRATVTASPTRPPRSVHARRHDSRARRPT